MTLYPDSACHPVRGSRGWLYSHYNCILLLRGTKKYNTNCHSWISSSFDFASNSFGNATPFDARAVTTRRAFEVSPPPPFFFLFWWVVGASRASRPLSSFENACSRNSPSEAAFEKMHLLRHAMLIRSFCRESSLSTLEFCFGNLPRAIGQGEENLHAVLSGCPEQLTIVSFFKKHNDTRPDPKYPMAVWPAARTNASLLHTTSYPTAIL